MRHCVYITLNSREEFYCDNYQKCCESNCCNDPFRWYYWISLILSFLLLVIALIACCRWKHRRSSSNVTSLNHVFPRLNPDQTGPHQVMPSIQVTNYPAYAWSVPNGLPCHSLPNQLRSPYMYPRNNQLQLTDQPPSYEELFGPIRSLDPLHTSSNQNANVQEQRDNIERTNLRV